MGRFRSGVPPVCDRWWRTYPPTDRRLARYVGLCTLAESALGSGSIRSPSTACLAQGQGSLAASRDARLIGGHTKCLPRWPPTSVTAAEIQLRPLWFYSRLHLADEPANAWPPRGLHRCTGVCVCMARTAGHGAQVLRGTCAPLCLPQGSHLLGMMQCGMMMTIPHLLV